MPTENASNLAPARPYWSLEQAAMVRFLRLETWWRVGSITNNPANTKPRVLKNDEHEK